MLQRHWVEAQKGSVSLACVSGTCINNTSVMMFKKGSFEIGATVYPVAIKVHGLTPRPAAAPWVGVGALVS